MDKCLYHNLYLVNLLVYSQIYKRIFEKVYHVCFYCNVNVFPFPFGILTKNCLYAWCSAFFHNCFLKGILKEPRLLPVKCLMCRVAMSERTDWDMCSHIPPVVYECFLIADWRKCLGNVHNDNLLFYKWFLLSLAVNKITSFPFCSSCFKDIAIHNTQTICKWHLSPQATEIATWEILKKSVLNKLSSFNKAFILWKTY